MCSRRSPPVKQTGISLLLKRTIDVGVSAAGLAATAPILVVTAAVVRLTMGSPVTFRQERPGRNGTPFRVMKFRTMKQAVDAEGRALPDAERLTAVGRFLRAWSIDELPQLWNVLRGDMSLVGPRPLLMKYLPLYSTRQRMRHEVLPGITGWAQINGRNAVSWEEKLELDAWYVEHWSPLLDLTILWRTCRRVISPEGIAAKGHATMPEFRGTPPPTSPG
jgi:lipopolysaccharide/colanic/teichoic acid biosynthesis glycosyltransferase